MIPSYPGTHKKCACIFLCKQAKKGLTNVSFFGYSYFKASSHKATKPKRHTHTPFSFSLSNYRREQIMSEETPVTNAHDVQESNTSTPDALSHADVMLF